MPAVSLALHNYLYTIQGSIFNHSVSAKGLVRSDVCTDILFLMGAYNVDCCLHLPITFVDTIEGLTSTGVGGTTVVLGSVGFGLGSVIVVSGWIYLRPV